MHHIRVFLLSGQNVDLICAKFGLEGRSYVARASDSPIPGEAEILAVFSQERVAGYLLIDPQKALADAYVKANQEPA